MNINSNISFEILGEGSQAVWPCGVDPSDRTLYPLIPGCMGERSVTSYLSFFTISTFSFTQCKNYS